MPLLVSSILLFYAGMAFAYFVVFPIMFGFFASVTPEGVAMMTDIGQYLDFVLTLFFAFGVAFEIPVATFLVIWIGLIDVATLTGARTGTFTLDSQLDSRWHLAYAADGSVKLIFVEGTLMFLK